MVEDPGYCAQYYPNSNCTNYGPGNPLYPGSFVPSGPAGAIAGPYAAVAPAHTWCTITAAITSIDDG